VVTVSDVVSAVEADLVGGRICCPRCQAVLRPWGWARERLIRYGTGAGRVLVAVRPRRGRCNGCADTQVLLGVGLAARRADSAAVIAVAIEAKAATGAGHRSIAALLGRPASTVRGWLRGFAAAASAIASEFAARAHRDGPDAAGRWPAPAPTAAGQALAAVAAYAGVIADRFAVAVPPWQSAGLAAAGPFFFSAKRWRSQANTSWP
jgi:hypothetical protein